jgi:hypothetical protein
VSRAGDAAPGDGSGACEVASSTFIPLIEGAVAEYIAKWQERPAPRGTAQQVGLQAMFNAAVPLLLSIAEAGCQHRLACLTSYACMLCAIRCSTVQRTVLLKDALRPLAQMTPPKTHTLIYTHKSMMPAAAAADRARP